MKDRTEKKCRYCEISLERNAIGLNKKLFEREAKRNLYMCLPCMADYLECSEEDLREKMEEFKREGCKLFS